MSKHKKLHSDASVDVPIRLADLPQEVPVRLVDLPQEVPVRIVDLPQEVPVRIVELPTTEDHLKSCFASSDRARYVIIAIIIASILVFVALWNSVQWSWAHERLKLFQNTVRWYPCLLDRDYSTEIASLKDGEVPTGFLRPPEFKGFKDPEELVDKKFLEKEDLPRFQDCKNFLKAQFNTLKPEFGVAMREYTVLQTQLIAMQDVFTHKVAMVTVPFVGIEFDVNDLGPLGGVCFVVLLLWLRFSFHREGQNLHMTFRRATQLEMARRKKAADQEDKSAEEAKQSASRGELLEVHDALVMGQPLSSPELQSRDEDKQVTRNELSEVYTSLAMGQVLTSPRLRGIRKEPLWDLVPYALFSLPLMDQLLVFVYDYYTAHIGSLFNSSFTIVALILDFSFLVLITILTIACIRKYQEINRLWLQAYKRLERMLRLQPEEQWAHIFDEGDEHQ